MYLLTSNRTITFLFILVIVLSVIVTILKTPKVRGIIGEKRVSSKLKRTRNCRYVIDNLIIPAENGKSSQLDHVLLSNYGIFVIETKNYSGRIYGGVDQLEWTQVLKYGKVKNKLYNPIKQNKTHIYNLSKFINESNIPYYSLVVFTNKAELEFRIDEVCQIYNVESRINRLCTESVISNEMLDDIYNKLLIQKEGQITTREHVKNIKETQKDIKHNVCPRCGSQLVLRHSKNGDFYGCSNYPKCSFTKRKY